MGDTRDFVELNESSDASVPVAPVGRARIVKRNGSIIASVDGGAYAPLAGGSVTTDGVTIQGNGTGGSPIAAKPSAALTPDFAGYFKALFQQKTGLSPLLIMSYAEDYLLQGDFAVSNYGAFAGGTGASTVYSVGGSGGGVIKLLGPSAGAGQADISNATRAAGPYVDVTNMRTKRWLIARRVASGQAPVAASAVSIGVISGATYIGLGYVGAVNTWQYVRGAAGAIANILDTTKTITNEVPPAGTGFLWMYLYNDGTNLRYCIDVVGGAAEAIAEASTNIPASAGYPYLFNRGVGAADLIFDDAIVFCAER